jgi:uncharacterized membrane protein (UPF0127 family)
VKNGNFIELKAGTGDAVRCRVADKFWPRFMGLMGKPPLPAGEGLLISPCNSIHMFFMKFAIDAIFLDREFRIVKVIRKLAPGKVVGTVKGAWQVLEIPGGRTPESFQEGTKLLVSPI